MFSGMQRHTYRGSIIQSEPWAVVRAKVCNLGYQGIELSLCKGCVIA